MRRSTSFHLDRLAEELPGDSILDRLTEELPGDSIPSVAVCSKNRAAVVRLLDNVEQRCAEAVSVDILNFLGAKIMAEQSRWFGGNSPIIEDVLGPLGRRKSWGL